jgi:hypothetical protein
MIPNRKSIWIAMALTFSAILVQAQSKLQLSSFKNNEGSWSEVAKVWADPLHSEQVLFSEGKGNIMLNAPTKKNPGTDIVTNEKFGDAEVTLVFTESAFRESAKR